MLLACSSLNATCAVRQRSWYCLRSFLNADTFPGSFALLPFSFSEFKLPESSHFTATVMPTAVCSICSPPEELVLPKEFPRVRIPFLAALLSPVAWQVGRPDLFDSYSAGVLLLQMAGVYNKFKSC